MASSTTFQALVPEIARHVYKGKGVIDVTGTGTAVGTVVVASEAYTSRSAYAYDGMGFYCYSAGGSAPEGEFRRVTTGGFTGSSGTWAIAPNWTAAPASGDKFLLLRGGLDANQFLDATNAVITAHFWPRYVPCTLVLDGDMGSSSTSAWADINSDATLSKDTASALTGQRNLKIVTTGLDDGAESGDVLVTENTQLLVSSAVKVTVGSIRVQLWDETNQLEIQGVTVDEPIYTEVRFTDSVPDNCEAVRIRYLSKTASTTVFVDHAIILPTDPGIYDLILGDGTEIDPAHVEGLFYQEVGQASEDANSYEAFTRALRPWPIRGSLRDQFAAVPFRLEIARPLRDPLWLKFYQTESGLTSLSSTTAANVDVIEYGAAAELVKRWINNLRRAKPELRAHQNELRATYLSALDSIKLHLPKASFTTRRVSVPSR